VDPEARVALCAACRVDLDLREHRVRRERRGWNSAEHQSGDGDESLNGSFHILPPCALCAARTVAAPDAIEKDLEPRRIDSRGAAVSRCRKSTTIATRLAAGRSRGLSDAAAL